MGKLIAIKNFIEVRWTRKFKNRESLLKYQDKMIKKQLKFLKNNSPYYKDINIDKLDEIGIIDKKIMMDSFNEMNTLGLDKDEALNIAIESEHTRDFSKKYDEMLKSSNKKKYKVAVMGCAVNGPGEAREADIGIAGGNGEAILFKKGKIIKKIKEDNIVKELLKEIDKDLNGR